MSGSAATALVLTCLGGGTAIQPDVATVSGNTSGSYDYGQGQFDSSTSGTITGTRQRGFADQVNIELNGTEGRIRLPRVTLPVFRGGKEGWFELRNVKVSDREITASAAVNLLNRPKVRIDRVTGIISINGMNGNYTGECAKVEPGAQQRF